MRVLVGTLLLLVAATLARADEGLPLPQRPAKRDLTKVDEDALLGPGGTPKLHSVGPERAGREPLILVHGIRGGPGDLQAVADRFAKDFQVYFLAYDDWRARTSKNGDGFARELRAFRGKPVTIVAHSMGGIVARRALNLVGKELGRVRFIGVDVPWHGYSGPKDGIAMAFARPFLADGLEDMRVRSKLFRDLYSVPLPGNVEVDLVFAREGDQVQDWTEKPLEGLPEKLVAHVTRGAPIEGDRRLEAFWKAIGGSRQGAALVAELTARARCLDAAAAREALERHFPRFPGDHTSVLRDAGLLDWLAARLR